MRVLDDFLDGRVFRAFLSAVTAEGFPWETTQVNSQPVAGLPAQRNQQLVHGFFLRRPGMQYQSPSFPLLAPVLATLRPRELVKIKLNRTPRQDRHVAYGLHVDTRWPGATTAILYLNTNNGFTLFEDGRQVASVANRLVVFDARLRHTGVSCTDVPERLVLNLNLLEPQALV
jgi:hypothetical protein